MIFSKKSHLVWRVFLISLLFPNLTSAQDAINMISGTVIYGTITERNDSVLNYKVAKRKGFKEYAIETDRVFSITKEGNQKSIVYQPEYDFEYSVEEMQRYVYAGRDAEMYYEGTFSFIAGFSSAAISSYFLYRSDNFFTLVTPLAGLAIGMHVGPYRAKRGKVRNSSYLNDEAYKAGYKSRLRSIRFSEAVKGAVLGTIVGVASGYIDRQSP